VKHVIIGASAAGISAAKAIRENSNHEIVIISADEAVYSRCMLHKYIGGSRNVAELSFIPDNFFAENKITWHGNYTVTGIDTAAKRVLLEGWHEDYDKLLIATGAESALPPIDGIGGLQDAKNVHGLRHLSDAKAIREKAETAKNIVIIGAGLVGLDAAYGLIEIDKKPTIVEMAANVLPQNMDAKAAEIYQEKFAEAGCNFLLESKVASVQTDTNGAVCQVTLGCGKTIPCDLLIVAVGVRPALDFVKDSGITFTRGIIVDNFFATNIADVYAAGDVTGISESWPDAMRHGEVAGLNMCGIATPYTDALVQKNTVNFFNVPTLSVGQTKVAAGDVEKVRESQSCYQKVILRDNVPVGVILQGDISRSGFWQHIIKNRLSVADIQKPVWKVSFADAYGVDVDGEYMWV